VTKDLTTGNPLKLILLFALPVLAGSLFQQFYSMVDAIIVGHTISSTALAGVGATSTINFFVLGFAQGLTMGFSVRTSHFYGAKNYDGVRRSIATSFVLSLVLSIVMTVVGSLAAKPLLTLLNTPASVFDDAYSYLGTIFFGMTANILYNVMSQTMRALGDSKTPLLFLILASVLNIGLDFLFILVFRMGTAGAGWATVCSQLIAGVGCLLFMWKKFPELRPDKKAWRIKWHNCRHHLMLGLPMALQTSITALGMMFQSGALNSLGETYLKAYTAASKLDNIMMQPLIALGAALATFCGQNYGARRLDRIKEGVKKAHVAAAIAAIIGLGVNFSLGRIIAKLFVPDATPEILSISSEYLFWQGVFYLALSFVHVYRNALHGVGKSTLTVIGGAIELVMRVIASFVLIKAWHFTGFSLSNPFAWVGAGLFLVIAYTIVIRRLSGKFTKLELREGYGASASPLASQENALAKGVLYNTPSLFMEGELAPESDPTEKAPPTDTSPLEQHDD